MTGTELYDLGHKNEQLICCVTDRLIHGLPRLERINGRLVLQFFYYQTDHYIPHPCLTPLFYAAVDARSHRLVEMKSFIKSMDVPRASLGLIFKDDFVRENAYLDHCAKLLEKHSVSEEELIRSQALWLDAHPRNAFDWVHLYSGVRNEAIAQLLKPDENSDTRHLLSLLHMEVQKAMGLDKESYKEYYDRWRQMTREDREIMNTLHEYVPMGGFRIGC